MEKFKEESEMVFIHPIVILSGDHFRCLYRLFRLETVSIQKRPWISASDFPWQSISNGKRFYILLWVGSLIGSQGLFI
jgi:hypothetical protein